MPLPWTADSETVAALHASWQRAFAAFKAQPTPETRRAEREAWYRYLLELPGPREPRRVDVDELAAKCEAEKDGEEHRT